MSDLYDTGGTYICSTCRRRVHATEEHACNFTDNDYPLDAIIISLRMVLDKLDDIETAIVANT